MSEVEINGWPAAGARHCIIVDGGSDAELSSPLLVKEYDPLMSDPGFEADISDTEVSLVAGRRSRPTTKKRHAIQRSVSHEGIERVARSTSRPATYPNREAHNKCSQPGQRSHASLRTPHPKVPRAFSSSTVETRSRYHDPAIKAADLQRELVARTKQADEQRFNSRRVQLTRSTSGPSNESNTENSAPTFRWYAQSRSSPDSDRSEHLPSSKPHSPEVPLKPCLKSKAKSTTTTPPGELLKLVDDDASDRTLRRVKTVDFEETKKPLLALPGAQKALKKIVHDSTGQSETSPLRGPSSAKNTSMAPHCPSMLSTAKSNLADPATTHADVHVIAIAPSRDVNNANNKASSDPATPTMQYVESNNGCYEVIWDDVPREQSDQRRRRSSVASHSLQLANPAAARGLQRVNSKLVDWSGSWNAPSDTFKPTIVVFPDHEVGMPQFECAVEDDDDLLAPVPPNSHRTSAVPSRAPSRPSSAPLTRAPSEEQIPLVDTLQDGPPERKQGWVVPLEKALSIPDPDLQSTRLLNATSRLRAIPTIRKLSNVDDTDLKFRGHRDSVTLAHTRFLRTGGVSPELFAHRDSVSMARKRMHARNHAVSAVLEIPGSNPTGYTSPLAISLDDTVLDMPLVKQHAAQALRSQKSASMLVPQPSQAQRHIRIVE
ncbi:hypothetical protein HBI56_048670 [Parastagonospora nodorum]|uniref:Uncharacterized protein n=3 Tax=Phaeosphaeria nodorum (strain SN15 / ATCC MYA-4574 / FGSC 10173) TaxID=321614 RepID=A0A7U2ERY6_PHANO|nr:hypothetical protein SNOG_02155 [Parastagonospora nodorum SN15]KAH3916666.1 hypothetical protein HBH56_061590 [Parastagonospora nodorum]EAT90367.1 hypothetical protein SNOG_02155 [Parastagonospora nodorum SN15]KAH3930773.1 hypothetical protein HBH54_105530 [Parastagonospora nodorum]KAH3977334.1 hypothetical protein HBH52_114630 [Parastagonospora nodorum]KAH4027593.1 hypothetical protein HBI09_140760 [Parastagonospora nodorum]